MYLWVIGALTLYVPMNSSNGEHSDSISGRVSDVRRDRRVTTHVVPDLPVTLGCILEQDTLSSVKYWFKPGRPD